MGREVQNAQISNITLIISTNYRQMTVYRFYEGNALFLRIMVYVEWEGTMRINIDPWGC